MIGMMASWLERVASSLSLFFDCVLVLGLAGSVPHGAWDGRVRLARIACQWILCLFSAVLSGSLIIGIG